MVTDTVTCYVDNNVAHQPIHSLLTKQEYAYLILVAALEDAGIHVPQHKV